MECKIDGKTVLTAKDSALGGAGKVGLVIRAEAPVYFDDFRVQTEDKPAPAAKPAP